MMAVADSVVGKVAVVLAEADEVGLVPPMEEGLDDERDPPLTPGCVCGSCEVSEVSGGPCLDFGA